MSITLLSPTLSQGPSSPHFPWCAHDGRFPGEHTSATATLTFPRSRRGLNVPTAPLLAAELYWSEEFPQTRVGIGAGDNDGVTLNAAEAAEFADRLIAFASRVRHLARLAAGSGA